MDKARPDGSVGLVRNRFDGGVEELVPFNREKQTTGLFAIEGRSVGHNPKPMVEILDGLACSLGASDGKIRAIGDRIRHVELRKITVRSRGGVDEANDLSKKDADHQLSGSFFDGQSTRGGLDSICRTRDKRDDPCQSNSRSSGDNQTHGDSNPGDLGVEERAVGGMDVEGH